MNNSNVREKTASLIFRGFSKTPEQIEAYFGTPSYRKGISGEYVRPGSKTILKKSYVGFTITFRDDEKLDQMLDLLFTRLGGLNKLIHARDEIKPEFIDVEFEIKITNPEKPQDKFLSANSISMIHKLQATLGFSFF